VLLNFGVPEGTGRERGRRERKRKERGRERKREKECIKMYRCIKTYYTPTEHKFYRL